MGRVVEILVAVNALAGIAAFMGARAVIHRMVRRGKKGADSAPPPSRPPVT